MWGRSRMRTVSGRSRPSCGDYLCVFIKVSGGGYEVKFKVYGCPAAIATTSILTDGKTLEEALEITDPILPKPWRFADPENALLQPGGGSTVRRDMDYRAKRLARQPVVMVNRFRSAII